MKKYKVDLPENNKLGWVAHQFTEVIIANDLYTVIRNCIEGNIDLSERLRDIDMKLFKTELLNKSNFLIKLDMHLFDHDVVSKYLFYQDQAIALTHLRNEKAGKNIIEKVFTGTQNIKSELDNLKENIKNLYALNERIKKEKELRKEISLNQDEETTISRLRKDKAYKFSTLKGHPLSILLIEYSLIQRKILKDYLFSSDGNQKERSKEIELIYGSSGDSFIKTKNDKFNKLKDLANLYYDPKTLIPAILFVYENLNISKENINYDLLKYLLEKYKQPIVS